jgi:hypothetical protein
VNLSNVTDTDKKVKIMKEIIEKKKKKYSDSDKPRPLAT